MTGMDDDLLPIGRFARLGGLSVGALRHYAEVGVLRRAEVDPDTGYRRYRASQLDDARTIARLRELEVPLEEIRDILASDDPAERGRRLADHRARLEARTNRLERVLHQVRGVTDRKEPIVTRPAAPPELDQAPGAGRRPVQPHLDAARDPSVHDRAGRDDPCRARLAVPLGRGQ
jgi:DNA-binding transcriptional MerR regulator